MTAAKKTAKHTTTQPTTPTPRTLDDLVTEHIHIESEETRARQAERDAAFSAKESAAKEELAAAIWEELKHAIQSLELTYDYVLDDPYWGDYPDSDRHAVARTTFEGTEITITCPKNGPDWWMAQIQYTGTDHAEQGHLAALIVRMAAIARRNRVNRELAAEVEAKKPKPKPAPANPALIAHKALRGDHEASITVWDAPGITYTYSPATIIYRPSGERWIGITTPTNTEPIILPRHRIIRITPIIREADETQPTAA
jgi:hypothetical protein